MSAYLPPDNVLPSFNSIDFPDTLSNEVIESKLNVLEDRTLTITDGENVLTSDDENFFIQSGQYQQSSGSYDGTITFPVAFTSVPKVFLKVESDNSIVGIMINVVTNLVSTTSVTFRKFASNTNTDPTTTFKRSTQDVIIWFAIGMI